MLSIKFFQLLRYKLLTTITIQREWFNVVKQKVIFTVNIRLVKIRSLGSIYESFI